MARRWWPFGRNGEASESTAAERVAPDVASEQPAAAEGAAIERVPESAPPSAAAPARHPGRPAGDDPSPADLQTGREFRRELASDLWTNSRPGLLGDDGGLGETAVFLREATGIANGILSTPMAQEVLRSTDTSIAAADDGFTRSLPSLMSYANPDALASGEAMDMPFGPREREESLSDQLMSGVELPRFGPAQPAPAPVPLSVATGQRPAAPSGAPGLQASADLELPRPRPARFEETPGRGPGTRAETPLVARSIPASEFRAGAATPGTIARLAETPPAPPMPAMPLDIAGTAVSTETFRGPRPVQRASTPERVSDIPRSTPAAQGTSDGTTPSVSPSVQRTVTPAPGLPPAEARATSPATTKDSNAAEAEAEPELPLSAPADVQTEDGSSSDTPSGTLPRVPEETEPAPELELARPAAAEHGRGDTEVRSDTVRGSTEPAPAISRLAEPAATAAPTAAAEASASTSEGGAGGGAESSAPNAAAQAAPITSADRQLHGIETSRAAIADNDSSAEIEDTHSTAMDSDARTGGESTDASSVPVQRVVAEAAAPGTYADPGLPAAADESAEGPASVGGSVDGPVKVPPVEAGGEQFSELDMPMAAAPESAVAPETAGVAPAPLPVIGTQTAEPAVLPPAPSPSAGAAAEPNATSTAAQAPQSVLRNAESVVADAATTAQGTELTKADPITSTDPPLATPPPAQGDSGATGFLGHETTDPAARAGDGGQVEAVISRLAESVTTAAEEASEAGQSPRTSVAATDDATGGYEPLEMALREAEGDGAATGAWSGSDAADTAASPAASAGSASRADAEAASAPLASSGSGVSTETDAATETHAEATQQQASAESTATPGELQRVETERPMTGEPGYDDRLPGSVDVGEGTLTPGQAPPSMTEGGATGRDALLRQVSAQDAAESGTFEALELPLAERGAGSMGDAAGAVTPQQGAPVLPPSEPGSARIERLPDTSAPASGAAPASRAAPPAPTAAGGENGATFMLAQAGTEASGPGIARDAGDSSAPDLPLPAAVPGLDPAAAELASQGPVFAEAGEATPGASHLALARMADPSARAEAGDSSTGGGFAADSPQLPAGDVETLQRAPEATPVPVASVVVPSSGWDLPELPHAEPTAGTSHDEPAKGTAQRATEGEATSNTTTPVSLSLRTATAGNGPNHLTPGAAQSGSSHTASQPISGPGSGAAGHMQRAADRGRAPDRPASTAAPASSVGGPMPRASTAASSPVPATAVGTPRPLAALVARRIDTAPTPARSTTETSTRAGDALPLPLTQSQPGRGEDAGQAEGSPEEGLGRTASFVPQLAEQGETWPQLPFAEPATAGPPTAVARLSETTELLNNGPAAGLVATAAAATTPSVHQPGTPATIGRLPAFGTGGAGNIARVFSAPQGQRTGPAAGASAMGETLSHDPLAMPLASAAAVQRTVSEAATTASHEATGQIVERVVERTVDAPDEDTNKQLSIEEIKDAVWQHIRRELRIERERSRGFS